MSEIKLFDIKDGVRQLVSSEVLLERELQTLIEKNMETLFGVRFLKSEYSITNGRMDSIGIDENNCPVIFEYKRSSNENVINQGLFYLDWLLDHKADFKLLVIEKMGREAAELIDWSVPCVICVANDFTKYDVLLFAIVRFQNQRTHDRTQRQSHYCRYQYRHSNGNGKLTVKLPGNATKETNRNKHGAEYQ